jgi:hypothetical protein
VNSTYAYGISPNANTAVGIVALNGFVHGFLRDVGNTFTVFDPPGSNESVPLSINNQGLIAGWYRDTNNVEHGFLRTP